jgi:hypothetical protein
MNQTLETALHTYVSPQWNDWDESLSGFALSYNGAPHSATGFTPALLLYGYEPKDGSFLHWNTSCEVDHSVVDAESAKEIEVAQLADPTEAKSVPRPLNPDGTKSNDLVPLSDSASSLADSFASLYEQAQDVLSFAQVSYLRHYNKGRLLKEFEIGELVLLNTTSLRLLGQEASGVGTKLLPWYNGPFEVLDKLSPVTYHIRLPSSYHIHPVLNIAHLEPYSSSPPHFGRRPAKPPLRAERAEEE